METSPATSSPGHASSMPFPMAPRGGLNGSLSPLDVSSHGERFVETDMEDYQRWIGSLDKRSQRSLRALVEQEPNPCTMIGLVFPAGALVLCEKIMDFNTKANSKRKGGITRDTRQALHNSSIGFMTANPIKGQPSCRFETSGSKPYLGSPTFCPSHTGR